MPLVIRGPGCPGGRRRSTTSSINADLAPTILDAAGATAGLHRGRALAAPVRRPPGALPRPRAADREGRRDSTTTRTATSAERHIRGDQDQPLHLRRERHRRARALRPRRPTRTSSRTRSPTPTTPRSRRRWPRGSRRCEAAPARPAARKPDLRLKLPRSKREHGRSCREAKDFLARVRGSAATPGGAGELRGRLASRRATTSPGRSRSGCGRSCCAASTGRR